MARQHYRQTDQNRAGNDVDDQFLLKVEAAHLHDFAQVFYFFVFSNPYHIFTPM
jgi:hypothetical protein